jgi:hypothetical protein
MAVTGHMWGAEESHPQFTPCLVLAKGFCFQCAGILRHAQSGPASFAKQALTVTPSFVSVSSDGSEAFVMSYPHLMAQPLNHILNFDESQPTGNMPAGCMYVLPPCIHNIGLLINQLHTPY